MQYKTEEEFLKNYNPKDFDQLSMTTDILIFSVSDGYQENYRKLKEKNFSILLVKRDDYPFKDKWCLPGGFIAINETLEQAATRVLEKETNLKDIYMEQLYTFSSVSRDPRTRIISTTYMSLIDKNVLKDKLPTNASWFNVKLFMDNDVIDVDLDNGVTNIKFSAKRNLKDMSTDKYEYKIIDNKWMAFDHAEVILTGIERLKNKIEYTDIVFNMMPRYFTLGELQQVYEIILGKKLLDPAFRRIIADKVLKTEKVKTGGGHRPSYYYQYKNKK